MRIASEAWLGAAAASLIETYSTPPSALTIHGLFRELCLSSADDLAVIRSLRHLFPTATFIN
jgi:hypothetical protein